MSFVNNIKSVLNAGINATANTIQVVKAVAPLQDPPTSGKLTLIDNLNTPTAIEIINYTGRTDNTTYWTLTGVTRGKESSTAASFNTGAFVIQAFTAKDANFAVSGHVQNSLGYINSESVFALRSTVNESHIKVVRTITSGGITYTASHFALSGTAKLNATASDWTNRLNLTYGVPS